MTENFLTKKISELSEAELVKEIEEELSTCGKDFGILGKMKETVINSRVTKTEVIRIKPNNPIINSGTLLGRIGEVPDDEVKYGLKGGMTASCVEDTDDEHPTLTLSSHKTCFMDDLFEYAKTMKKTLLVVDDYIEIIKTTTVSNGLSSDTNTISKSHLYKITHYVEVLDSNDMYRLATKLFSPGARGRSWSRTQHTKILSLREIVETYNQGSVEEALFPLEIVS